MNKSDLRTGMIVETREGYHYMVVLNVKNSREGSICRIGKFTELSNYCEDLTHTDFSDMDIIKIYENPIYDTFQDLVRAGGFIVNNCLLVWKRENPVTFVDAMREAKKNDKKISYSHCSGTLFYYDYETMIKLLRAEMSNGNPQSIFDIITGDWYVKEDE